MFYARTITLGNAGVIATLLALLTAAKAAGESVPTALAEIRIEPVSTNTGNIFIGDAQLDGAGTKAGVKLAGASAALQMGQGSSAASFPIASISLVGDVNAQAFRISGRIV